MNAKKNVTPEADSQEKQEEKKPNKTKWSVVISLIAVQLIAAVLLVYFVIVPRVWPNNKKSDGKAQVAKKKEKQGIGVIYTISDLTVNPKDSYGRRFAVFEIALELPNKDAKAEIEKFKPVIVDNILEYLRSKTVAELTVELDIEQMKSDLKNRVNNILGHNLVRNLYFTRFVLE